MSVLKELSETGIPKLFWYTISFCLLYVVLLFSWIAYKSQAVSIDIASTKIQIVSSISQVEKAYDLMKEKEASTEKECADLKEENASLAKENVDLKKNLSPLAVATRPSLAIPKAPQVNQQVISPKVANDTLDRSIENLRSVKQQYEMKN